MANGRLHCIRQHLRRLIGLPCAGDLTDRQLLERFAEHRDDLAFAALVQRHGPLVLGVCRRLLGNDHDAEDAFQACFLLLAQKASQVRWHDCVANWLYQVACRTAQAARVQSARRRKHENQAAAMPPRDTVGEVESARLRQALDEELLRLPDRYRVPLLLCCMQSKSRGEAAQQLGWTEGMVKGRLERGRELLRRRLARQGVAWTAGAGAAFLGPAALAALPPALVLTTTQAAAGGAIPASVAALMKGTVQAMFWAKLRTTVLACVGLLAFGAVAGLALHQAFAKAPLPADSEKRVPADLPDNATARWLGAADQWERCRLVLADIHGLWGGQNVYLYGSGLCIVRVVDKAPQEKRYRLQLTAEEAAAFRRLVVEADLVELQIKERSGVPDESRPRLTLTNAAGQRHEVAKWGNDKVPAFDSVYKALCKLKDKTKDQKPEYEGKIQTDWKPPEK